MADNAVKRALQFLIAGGNRVADAAMKDPGQFSIGTQFQRGNFPGSGYLNQETKNFIGGAANLAAPMDKIIGGAYQGKPMDVVEGGGRMLGAVNLASLINPYKAAMSAPVNVTQARDLFGRYAKQSPNMISQLRNQAMNSSANTSQAAIEQALNQGNYQNALKLAQSLAQGDPYRESMIKMITRMMQ